jgi:hypothetical protein
LVWLVDFISAVAVFGVEVELPNVLPGAGSSSADYELRPSIYPWSLSVKLREDEQISLQCAETLAARAATATRTEKDFMMLDLNDLEATLIKERLKC